ncbi:hypothetical protein [Klebsiella pneumoniae]|nr:hypothetical protein [Klebsiella pneumoniae]MDX6783743.1 hypothetical protein [Klebsiella pneumoniae]HBT6038660.1 acyltransferase [Klebsiella pneumoniae]
MIGGISNYICKLLENNIKLIEILRNRLISIILMVLLIYVFFSGVGIFNIFSIIILLLFFIAIVCGNNLFGALTLKGARLLGEISYSIYLIHGCVIFSIFILMNKFSGLSLSEYLILMPFVTIAVVFISSLTYRFIEAPCINIGKKIQNIYRFNGKKAL